MEKSTIESIYSVSSRLYCETARRLCDATDGQSYFSGSLDFLMEQVECRLICSVIVYRSVSGVPGESGEAIIDLIPVWWEFHTTTDKEELLNDFSFDVLKRYMI